MKIIKLTLENAPPKPRLRGRPKRQKSLTKLTSSKIALIAAKTAAEKSRPIVKIERRIDDDDGIVAKNGGERERPDVVEARTSRKTDATKTRETTADGEGTTNGPDRVLRRTSRREASIGGACGQVAGPRDGQSDSTKRGPPASAAEIKEKRGRPRRKSARGADGRSGEAEAEIKAEVKDGGGSSRSDASAGSDDGSNVADESQRVTMATCSGASDPGDRATYVENKGGRGVSRRGLKRESSSLPDDRALPHQPPPSNPPSPRATTAKPATDANRQPPPLSPTLTSELAAKVVRNDDRHEQESLEPPRRRAPEKKAEPIPHSAVRRAGKVGSTNRDDDEEEEEAEDDDDDDDGPRLPVDVAELPMDDVSTEGPKGIRPAPVHAKSAKGSGKARKDKRKYVWIMTISRGTGQRDVQTLSVAAFSCPEKIKQNSLFAMESEVERAPGTFEFIHDYRQWMEEEDKFGVLFKAESQIYRFSVQFEKILLDRDLRMKERGRKRVENQQRQEDFIHLGPSSTLAPIVQSRRPPSLDLHCRDPVWLLVRLEANSVENIEHDVVVCSSKEMTIYNAVCLMDKVTNRQFRTCSSSFLGSVAASMDVNESDIMFKMTEKKGRENSIGFRRFFLDESLAPEGNREDVDEMRSRQVDVGDGVDGEREPLDRAESSRRKRMMRLEDSIAPSWSERLIDPRVEPI